MPKQIFTTSQVKKITGASRHQRVKVPLYYAPPFLDNLRDWIESQLTSRGGRPTIQGAEVIRKVRFSKKNWKELEGIAQHWSKNGVSISPSQVATSILSIVLSEASSTTSGKPG